MKGTRFGSFIEMDSASTASPHIKHTALARPTFAQLDKLTKKQRQTAVEEIKEYIQALKVEKKEKRDEAAAQSKEKRIEEEANKRNGQDEAK